MFCNETGEKVAEEDVVFIHGFLSSSKFWTETVFPNVSEAAKSRYRLLAVDLLGFGRSPKPPESLYTLREHVEMIESSVLQRFQVKSFHIVAHSLGSILALALAVKYPGAVKSLTLLAPVISDSSQFIMSINNYLVFFCTYLSSIGGGSHIFRCRRGSTGRTTCSGGWRRGGCGR